MTIIKTGDGLIIYSPVRLATDLIESFEPIGEVSTIIAPNLYHHLFLREWVARFPNARVFVPKGLEAKIGLVDRAEEIDADTSLPAPAELERFTFSDHGIRETLLYHVPSKSLITADLLYNYTSSQFFAEKLWFRLIGCYGRPAVAFYHRFSIKRLSSVWGLIRWVSEREVRRIIMGHGQIVEGANAGELFTTAWRQVAKLG